MLRMVNLISGSGTTNLAILKAEQPGGKLSGLTETVAIISSSSKAEGIKLAKEFGFPATDIYVVDPDREDLTKQLLKIFDKYKPDYFHQLGWMPLTPVKVLERYRGLNQHLGPGGRWMYGIRRIYAHIRFCEMIGEKRPIPIFIQMVAPKYDEGEVIYLRYEDLLPSETPGGAAERLKEIEHRVQIEGLRRLAVGDYQLQPVPKIAKNPKEEELLFQARKDARDKIPRK